MTILVYPEDWTPPVAPPPAELTAPQRAWIKTRMQNYITTNGPVSVGRLAHIGHDRLISEYNKHIRNDVLREIALEIREEWGYPGQEEAP